ncbi:MAG: FtsX-like permease family protein [Acidobacteria bacterium]|nr:FtsX-like permease family protein [Acidobacteriota bacterium]
MAGIMFGVCGPIAVISVNHNMVRSFELTFATTAGKADLQVFAVGGEHVQWNLVDRIRKLPAVALAVPVVRGSGYLRAHGDVLPLQFYGIELPSDLGVREYHPKLGNLPTAIQDDWVLISSILHDKLDATPGSDIVLLSAAGRAESLRVQCVLSPIGLASLNDGAVAFVSLAKAQHLAGLGREVTAIDIVLRRAVNFDAARQTIQAILPPSTYVDKPTQRTRFVEDVLASFSLFAILSASVAVAAGAFVVYANVSVAGRRKRVQAGIVRALGGSRQFLQVIAWLDTIVISIIGSGLGGAAGIIAARLSSKVALQELAVLLDVSPQFDDRPCGVLLLAFGLGFFGSVSAAVVPIVTLLRVSPLSVLHKQLDAPMPHGRRSLRVAIAVFAVSLICFICILRYSALLPRWLEVDIGAAALVGGATAVWIASTSFIESVAGVLGASVTDKHGAIAELTLTNLRANPGRYAATVSVFAICIGFVVGHACFEASFSAYLRNWMERSLGWDVRIGRGVTGPVTAQRPFDQGAIARAVAAATKSLVSPQTFVEAATVDGDPILLSVFVMLDLPKYAALPILKGSKDAFQRVTEEVGVIAPSSTARQYALTAGSTITIRTSLGPRTVPIVAVVDSFSPLPELYVDRTFLDRYFPNLRDRVDFVVVKFNGGDRLESVVAALSDADQLDGELQIQELDEFRRTETRKVEALLGQIRALTMCCLLVACLALGNCITLSILDRKRELATLRAIGASPARVFLIILADGSLVGLIGLGCGVAIGLGLGLALIQLCVAYSGLQIVPVFPYIRIGFTICATAGSALLAVALPAFHGVAGLGSPDLRDE